MSNNNILMGVVAGDMIGSVYERFPTKEMDFPLFNVYSHFTDDTVMTMANADWLLHGGNLASIMQEYGRRFPRAGYGGRFRQWLRETNPQPYHSFGNGSAMRVCPVGWAFDSLEETLEAARKSAEVTHNHPEGIKGAQATAACVFLARTGKSKPEIKKYVEETFGYDLNRTCEEIRPKYDFDVTCQGTVPEGTDYEHAIRLAISLGGDADTLGAITGGMAEAYYKEIPAYIEEWVMQRLPEDFIRLMQEFSEKYGNRPKG